MGQIPPRAWAGAHARAAGMAGAGPAARRGAAPPSPSPAAPGEVEAEVEVEVEATAWPVALAGPEQRGYTVLAVVAGPDGRPLVVADDLASAGVVAAWDTRTGARVGAPTAARSAPVATTASAWSPCVLDSGGGGSGNGAVLLATGHADGSVRVWRAGDEAPACVMSGHTGGVGALAWALGADGGALVATGARDGAVRVWDAGTGECLRVFPGHWGAVPALGWLSAPFGPFGPFGSPAGRYGPLVDRYGSFTASGPELLGTADGAGTIRLWDVEAGRLRHAFAHKPRSFRAVVWFAGARGEPLCATGGTLGDPTLRVWDADTGALRRSLYGHTDVVMSLACIVMPGGWPLLASGGWDGVIRLWDPASGACLREVSVRPSRVRRLAWALDPDGRALLAVAGDGDPIRLYSVAATGADPLASHTQTAAVQTAAVQTAAVQTAAVQTAAVQTAAAQGAGGAGAGPPPLGAGLRVAVTGMVALGSGGGPWPPLPLVTEILAITEADPAAAPAAGWAAGLARHPAVARLRELRWPAPARVGFAGLLTAGLPTAEQLLPPAGVDPTLLRDTLLEVLGAARPAAQAPRTAAAPDAAGTAAAPDAAGTAAAPLVRPAVVDALTTAADRIDARVLALLAILGPKTVAVDPALPLRLAGSASAMPALGTEALTTLHDALALVRSDRRARPPAAAGGVREPGELVVAWRGPFHRLLPTELALPARLRALRYVRGELLYRAYAAAPEPPVDPVTIILDVSPPTFGPAEIVLRSAAHLIAVIQWRSGHNPGLVTLDRPAVAVELAGTAQLARTWTARTLEEADVVTALSAARAGPHRRVIVLTQHHLARELPLRPGPALRVLTTNSPGNEPDVRRGRPGAGAPGRYHRHVSPGSAPAELVAAVRTLLAPEPESARTGSAAAGVAP